MVKFRTIGFYGMFPFTLGPWLPTESMSIFTHLEKTLLLVWIYSKSTSIPGEPPSIPPLLSLSLSRLADLDPSELANATVFAPSESALKKMPSSFMEGLRADKQRLRDFLLYHVANPKTCKCDFKDGLKLQVRRMGTIIASRQFSRVTRLPPISLHSKTTTLCM